MESSTKTLRRLLDERGTEHYDYRAEVWWGGESSGGGGAKYTAYEQTDGLICVEIADLTPEQAIAATLGTTDARPTQEESSGTCKLDDFADVPFSVDYEIEGYDMGSGSDYATLAECSACGAYIIVPPEYHHVLTCDGDEVYQPYRFCPNCGAKVVGPTTNNADAEVGDD